MDSDAQARIVTFGGLQLSNASGSIRMFFKGLEIFIEFHALRQSMCESIQVTFATHKVRRLGKQPCKRSDAAMEKMFAINSAKMYLIHVLGKKKFLLYH